MSNMTSDISNKQIFAEAHYLTFIFPNGRQLVVSFYASHECVVYMSVPDLIMYYYFRSIFPDAPVIVQ